MKLTSKITGALSAYTRSSRFSLAPTGGTVFLTTIMSLFVICCSNNTKSTSNNDETIISENSQIELPNVFDTYEQEAQFKKLVGDDFKHFVTAFATISEDEDLDNIEAKVYSGMVPGLGTIKECIVMKVGNEFMAAFIDGDTIKYFSSNKNYKTTIPNTMNNWISEKGKKSIQYKK